MPSLRNLSKKQIIIMVIVLVVVGGGGFLVWKRNNDANNTNTPGQTDPTVDLEKENTKKFNDSLEAENNSDNPSSSSNNKTKANTILSYVSAAEARGYVSNVLEENGTCTITLTKGSAKVMATSTGMIDVNKTICQPIQIDQSQLTSGEWNAVLSYSSATAEGASAAQTVRVP